MGTRQISHRIFGRGGTSLQDRLNEQAFANVYQLTDRIISGQLVTCEFDELGGIAPALSIGPQIVFDRSVVKRLETDEGMVEFAGLNYHELSHVMFTPPQNVYLTKTVIQHGLQDAYNVLEDQRIESLMVAKYRSIAPYFVAAFTEHILNNPDGLDTAYALAAGRRYLPKKLREGLRNQFLAPNILDEIDLLISEYRRMAFRRDGKGTQERAFKIVKRFHDLLHDNLPQAPEPTNGHGTEKRVQTDKEESEKGEGTVVSKSTPRPADETAKEKAQEKAAQDLRKQDAEGDDAFPQFDGEDIEDGDGGGAGGDSDGDEGEDGAEAGSGDVGDAQGDSGSPKKSDKGKEGSSQKSGNEKGGGGASEEDDGTKSVQEIAKQIAENLAKSKSVKDEVRSMQKQARRQFGKVPLPPVLELDLAPVSPEHILASRRFGQTLLSIWADTDPGYAREQSSGRLNLKRAMTGEHDLDTVFDQWRVGERDATDIELVLLLDCSDSMDNRIDPVSQAAWAIKKAVDGIGGKTTAFSYDTRSDTVYMNTERVHPTMFKKMIADNATDPLDAIKQAGYLLENSESSTKVLITLTDGMWKVFGFEDNETKNKESHDLIDKMRSMGVITSLGYISDREVEHIDPHHHQSAHALTTAGDLITLAKSVVAEAMKRHVVAR